jgi:hypothetical protein
MPTGFFRLNDTPPSAPGGIYRYRFQSASANFDEWLEYQVDGSGVATQHGSSGSFVLQTQLPSWGYPNDLAIRPPVADDYILTMYNNSPLGGATGIFNTCQNPDQCNPTNQCGSEGVKLTNELGTLPITPKSFFGFILPPQASYSISGLRIFDRPNYNTDPCGIPNFVLSMLGMGGFTTFESTFVGVNPICGEYQTSYGIGTETFVPIGYKFFRQLQNSTDGSVVDNNGVFGGYLAPQLDPSCNPPCLAGTTAPNLSTTTLSNVCPVTTANLGSITASNRPANTVLEFHSAATPNSSNKITNLSVGAGTYYAVFFDSANNCYSPSTQITVTVNNCCVPVSGGTINGNINVTVNQDETYTISGLIGTTPYNILHTVLNGILISGQGSTSIVVKPTSTGTKITSVITNCSGTGTITLTKDLDVKTNCIHSEHFKITCSGFLKEIVSVVKNGETTNRLINYTNDILSFTADVGTFKYIVTLKDNNDIIHTVTYNNINC